MKNEKTKKKVKKSIRVPLASEDDELVFAVCERFFQQMSPAPNPDGTKKRSGAAAAVAEWLATERNRPDVNREKIYPLVWEAFQRNFLLMRAPIEKNLSAQLVEKYGLAPTLERTNGEIVVVNVAGQSAPKHVGSVAADRIIDLIYLVADEKKKRAADAGDDPENVRVHLGFGAGYAAMEVARRLSERADAQTPKLTLHAISPGGFYLAEPQKAPTTYFNYFVDKGIDFECVGFFSPPVVLQKDYEKLISNPALRQSFGKRDEIDVVVTSLASATDEDGLFGQYFNLLKKEGLIETDELARLRKKRWVGDVLFQPYSAEGWIKPQDPKDVRAVTLFDFEELARFSQTPGKRVVVVGAPCADCGATKTDALRPLLENNNLRLWTSLIVDRQTAKELLR